MSSRFRTGRPSWAEIRSEPAWHAPAGWGGTEHRPRCQDPHVHVSTTLSIAVYFDLICPWCLIGKRHLDTAIAQIRAEQPELAIAIEWRSFPLIPDTPLAGVDYRAFYVQRLGSPEAVAARQAQVRAAAGQAGLALALERIATFPSSLLGHRLVRFARQAQGAEAASALVEELFTRYFVQAEDIGDARVLRQALQACGIATPGADDEALHHDLPWLPPLVDAQAPMPRGVTGVPFFVFSGRQAVSGAVPAGVLVRGMQAALGSTG